MKEFLENLFKIYNIKNLSTDSRKIKDNAALFMLAKNPDLISKYIRDAVDKGAKLIFLEKANQANLAIEYNNIKIIYLDNLEEILFLASSIIYNNEPKYKVAVTGTNGKSSVASYFEQICKLLGKASASLGTLGVSSAIEGLQLYQNLTTEDFITNKMNLHSLAKHNIEYVCMEASSHGLYQRRLGDIKFNSASFISFSQDHFDYHKSIDDYLAAKLILFKNHMIDNGVVVINREIDVYDKIINYLKSKCNVKIITIGSGDQDDIDWKIISIKPTIENIEVKLQYKNNDYKIIINVVGSFQIYNILIASIMAESVGFDFEEIIEILPQLKAPHGRLERISGKNIFIDYAHSPESLEFSIKELLKLKPREESKLITLFGCGGDRDKSKRRIMGEIASSLSDIAIITDDNPRTEDPKEIRKEILSSINNQDNVIEIEGREDAIKKAIYMMNEHDILLIAGKGHEKFQIIGDKKIEFDEFKIVRKYLK